MSQTEFKDLAWNNASSFEIDNPSEYRVCYICYKDFLADKINQKEARMNYADYNETMNLNGWCVDFIDGNKNNTNPENLVAVHCDCHKFKKHQNFTKLYQFYKQQTSK